MNIVPNLYTVTILNKWYATGAADPGTNRFIHESSPGCCAIPSFRTTEKERSVLPAYCKNVNVTLSNTVSVWLCVSDSVCLHVDCS